MSIKRTLNHVQSAKKKAKLVDSSLPDWTVNETVEDQPVKKPIAITMQSVRIKFPYPPYQAQVQMMNKIIDSLKHSENALLESPTGTGKSLALLCSVLGWREKEAEEQREKMAKNVATKPVVKITVEEDDDFQTSSKYFQPEKDTLDEIKIPIEPPPATLPRIFVGSRTHKQLTQLVSELKKKTPYRPRMTVLGSREQLCIHPKVKKSADKAEDCKNLLDTNSCYYAHKTRKLMAHPSLHNEHKVWDIEDLVKLGNRVSGCPYYASRKLYDQAEVVFCPYNYILDPVIRKILDIKLKDSIIILDEAHNIEDASRSAGSFEINELALNSIAIQCDILSHSDILPTSHNQIGDFIRKFHTWMTSKQKFTIREFDQHLNLWSGYEIIQLLVSLDITPFFFTEIIIPAFIEVQSHAETMRKEAEKKSTDDVELEEGQIQQPDSSQERGPRIKYLTNASLTALQGIIMILGYLFREDKQYYNDYKMVLINKKDRKENKRHKEKELIWTLKLGFWCMNPGIIFQELTNDTRSVILTSGTLSPLDTFSSELETDFPRQLEANHVIGPSQVWAAVVPKGPNNGNLLGTYTQVDKYQYQDEVGESILRIIQTVPFGVLCFMSSYALMEKLIKRWKETGLYKRMNAAKTIYTESKVSDKKVFDKTLKNFYSEIDGYTANYNTKKNGCLFFAVYRGKVSEGIDFSDNYCRAVIAIGIPFPAIQDIQVQSKKSYNDLRKSKHEQVLSGGEWYSAQAYKAINQALGRCIRHRNDWGAIILLEDRFNRPENMRGLSKWIQKRIRNDFSNFNDAMRSLEEFSRVACEKNGILEEVVIHDVEDDDEAIVKAEDEVTVKTETTLTAETTVKNAETTSTAETTLKEEPLLSQSPRNDYLPTDIIFPCVTGENTQEESSLTSESTTVKSEHTQYDIFKVQPVDPPEQSIIRCGACNEPLLTGSKNNIHSIDTGHLDFFLYALPNSDTSMIEILPSEWKPNDHLKGGPIDVKLLEDRKSLINVKLDTTDKLIFRLLHCHCKPHTLIGAVIYGSIEGSKFKEEVGKVYFWKNKVTYKKPTHKVTRLSAVEEFPHIDVSSQAFSTSDLYYY